MATSRNLTTFGGANLLLALAVTAITFLTLTPVGETQDVAKTLDLCIQCTSDLTKDAIANVVLFIPLGVALACRGHSVLLSTAAGLLLSLLIELLQYFIPGRYPTLQDLLSNGLGAGFGFLIAQHWIPTPVEKAGTVVAALWEHLKRPDRRLADSLSIGATLTLIGILGLTAWLLSPAYPKGPYVVGAKELNSTDRPLRIGSNGQKGGYFKGTIDEARIYRKALAPDSISAAMREPLDGRAIASEYGLIVGLDFEEPGGDQVVDSSGQGHHGAMLGVGRVQGFRGNGVQFNGRSSQIVIPSAPDLKLREEMTLMAWVRPEPSDNAWPAVIQKGKDDYFLYAGADGVLFPSGGGTFGGINEGVNSPSNLSSGSWSHIATSYDGSTLRLYLNAKEVASLPRWFPGEIESVWIGEAQILPGELDREWLRDKINSGARIRLEATSGPIAPNTRSLLDIRSRYLGERVLVLAANEDDLVLRFWTMAQSIGLPSPDIRLPDALRKTTVGAPLSIAVSGCTGNREISVNAHPPVDARFTLGMSWALAAESRYFPTWLQGLLSFVWIGALTFPVGFWSRGWPRTMLGGVSLTVAMLLVPAVTSLAPTPFFQWVGALIGFLTGIVAQRIFAHPHP